MATSRDLEAAYQNARKSRTSLDQEQSRLANEAGVGQRQASIGTIRKTIADTERMLEAAPTDVVQRSRRLGGPVTSAVLNRLTQVKTDPLAKQLGGYSRTLGVEQEGLNTANQDVLQKLGLIQAQRASEDQDFVRQIEGARSMEQFQAQLAAQRRAQQVAMDDERRKQEALSALFGGGSGGATRPTVGINSVIGGKGAAPVDNSFGSQLSKLYLGAAGAATAPGNAIRKLLGMPTYTVGYNPSATNPLDMLKANFNATKGATTKKLGVRR